jgi:hypothetical protein
MINNYIFSWAESANGKMVHVDTVKRGLECNCFCPNCHEKLMARHGDIREHGFAHHSYNRGANLKICYMVTLYKLAEQIIQTNKKIHVPSYYKIFPEKDIEFIDVKIDSSYEREDKQPDVIATTRDGKQYLIEFIFSYKIQHKQAIDYENMTCLEIDLSNQNLETLEAFLLESNEDRKWINNQTYFERIESRYAQAQKNVKVIEETECITCKLRYRCCGVREKGDSQPLIIENSGKKYRICKPDKRTSELERIKQKKQEAKLEKSKKETRIQEKQRQTEIEEEKKLKYNKENQTQKEEYQPQLDEQTALESPLEKSCFNCQTNLSWKNRGSKYANCGAWKRLQIPINTPPEYAQTCKSFKPLHRTNSKSKH